MADTTTPNIKLTNQTEGGNLNTWGTIADANFEQIDNKFGDVTSISTTGGTTTLSESQEIVNAIVVSGTLVSNSVIVFSGRGGTWVVQNNTSGSYSVTCKVSGQTGVTIEQGGAAVVYCNGTDIKYGNPPASTAAEVTVASATTTDILGAASEYIAISGTGTIASLGTGANKTRFVRATGAFTLTHNATSLILPGAKDIVAASGDTFVTISDSSSNVRVHNYQRAVVPPNMFPVGSVIDYAGSSAPSGWLLCYGQNVSRTTYAALFAAISVTYGVGDGSSTFTLPDARGRVVAGKDNMGGSSADRLTNQTNGIDGDTLGAVGGAETHTLTTAQSAAHTHTGTTASGGAHTHGQDNTTVYTQTPSTAAFTVTAGASTLYVDTARVTESDGAHTHTFTTDSTGGGGAHNNVQPTLVLNKIIFAGV